LLAITELTSYTTSDLGENLGGSPSIAPLLHARNISKSFGPVRVLSNVSFELRSGEVHLLAGENGAGKSTLIKMFSGIYQPDTGTIEFSPQSTKQNISVIHQEMSLIGSMSVLDNIFLGREQTNAGFIARRKQEKKARELCEKFGLDVDLKRAVGSYPLSTQTKIEVVKALVFDARIFIMDEPTSTLSTPEVDQLFRLIHELKQNGCGIIYISHKMEEIYRIADRITVLRDGKLVCTEQASQLKQDALIRAMLGRDLKEQFVVLKNTAIEKKRKKLFSAKNFKVPGVLDDISLEVEAGEVVGLAGLQGSGAAEFMSYAFGAHGSSEISGEFTLQEKPFVPQTPSASIARGLALVTGDRKRTGLVLDLPIEQNIALASLPKFSPMGWIKSRKIKETAQARMRELSVRADSSEQPVKELSGGNQQKVVLAKWLETDPQVLFLDEPTRGIDVGAKRELYARIREWVGAGMGIVLISSELPELLALSDRVLVLHRGKKAAEFTKAEATAERILHAAMGGNLNV